MEIKNKLAYEIIKKSESKEWKEAVKEWEVDASYRTSEVRATCICGKEKIKNKYKLVNKNNGKYIYPVSKKCIKRLGRDELNREVNIIEEMKRLEESVAEGEYLCIESGKLSKKLIDQLYKEGAFKGNKHNKFSGKNDYEFVVKMINKRNKNSISEQEEKKLKAIMMEIKKYIKEKKQG